MRRGVLAAVLLSTASAVMAQVPPQNSRPSPTPKTDVIPTARDVPYPGTLQLTVDASDVTRGIFKIHEHVPVPGAGDFVMLYPKWIPGGHTPRGDIKNITGFRPSANGKPLDWEELPTKRACRIAEYREGCNVAASERWEEYIDWFLDAGTRLRAALAVVALPF